MEIIFIVKALAALAQESRLQICRSLVQAGSEGLTPGDLAKGLSVAPNTLSFHLKELMNAKLIKQERIGRHLIYRADFQQFNQILGYLTQNCCQGEPCEIKHAEFCTSESKPDHLPI